MNIPREQLRAAYDKLPRPVRAYLSSTEISDLMQTFGQKYGLHVDVVGQLSEAVSYMLLGFVSPAQFQDELKAMGIPEGIITTIIQDLNEQVFKPLQEKIRNAPPEEPEQEEEEEPIPPAPTAPLVPPARIEAPQMRPTIPTAPPRSFAPELAPELIQEQKMPEPPPFHVSSAPIPPTIPQTLKPPSPSSASADQNRDALRQVIEGYKGVDPYRETPE
jgi:hypothetical protein